MKDWRFLVEKFVLGKHRPYSEKIILRALMKFKGHRFIDIGANEGYYSIPLSKNFKEVYAFEPNTSLFSKWKQKPPNVRLMPVALANSNGPREFYQVGPWNSLASTFDYKAGHGAEPKVYRGENPVMVESRTYDSFAFDFTDLVKIDVDGAEFEVLHGMESSLQTRKIGAVMIEVHNMEWESSVTEVLQGHGFKVKVLDRHPHLLGRLN